MTNQMLDVIAEWEENTRIKCNKDLGAASHFGNGKAVKTWNEMTRSRFYRTLSPPLCVLFAFSLFNDAVSISDYTASNGRMISE
jgi:hypothetical protein